ncbi:outer membrane beta-barrel protein [Bacteroides salyersiae]|jgi:hypothetical protein|uniref:outer membrane beta-barrel protein n=1 Tax=Bacteroides salyersiae TaxID=291644 RepID=UPI001C8C9E6F|nr:outer membrane beta-barrel protein [Bacteroides salyersiae]
MANFKFYLTTVLLAVGSSLYAQFTNQDATTITRSSPSTVNTVGWNKIYVSYNPMKMVIDKSGADDLNFTGFSAGYAKGISISQQLPFFIEVGINLLYATNTYDNDGDLTIVGEKVELKTTLMSANIPVNVIYKFTLANKKISFLPFAGINFRGNIIGKSKYELTEFEEGKNNTEKDFWKKYEDSSDKKQETNNFDKKETGSKNDTWKRFQAGWQIGLGINFNQLYIGVSYEKDFNELYKKAKLSSTSITIGCSF